MKSKQNLEIDTQHGFTLVELMVVIATIALLASIILISLNNARIKGRDTRRISDIHQLTTALELYFNQNFGYPVQTVTAKTIPGAFVGTFVSQLPVSPLPPDSATCAAAATGGINNDYLYTSATGATYSLTFCLGNGLGALGAGVHTASPSGIN